MRRLASRPLHEAEVERRPLHVLVVTGPSCVGKTTLLAELLSGKRPRWASSLGLLEPSSYRLLHARQWRELEQADSVPLLLHYELTRTTFLTHGPDRDKALSVLARADRVTFLTLWEFPAELRSRFRTKVSRKLARDVSQLRIRHARRTFRRYVRRRRFFVHDKQMWRLYRDWFNFTAGLAHPHWVARASFADELPSLVAAVPSFPFWDTVECPAASLAVIPFPAKGMDAATQGSSVGSFGPAEH